MDAATLHDTIDIADLRVGMFIHLDGGWMSHPFPLSSFRVVSPDQIATIRALGVRRLRWSPAQSEPLPPAPAAAAPAVALAPSTEVASDAETAAAAPSPRERLAAQRSALQLCERQFAEAARECRLLTDLAPMRPREACEHAEALVSTLATKMLGEGDLCIRLLTQGAGDKASKHALNVTVLSMLMGRAFGLGESDLLDLGVGAMLHDIGKCELPARVRMPGDDFTSADHRYYEEHVAHGVEIGRRMGITPGAGHVIAQHHEHADGSGFPMRLNADRMTVAARIVALVNHYDNLCNPHRPGAALTPHESLSLLFTQSQRKFETSILGAFIKMMGVYPAGSTVQLTDDRYALVVAANSSRPLRPRVLVHDAAVPAEEAIHIDLDQAGGLGIRRSLRPQQLPPKVLAYLAPPPQVAYFFSPALEPSLAV